jgi:uncharacterized protein YjbJ (UPF0337 family)
MNRHQVTSIGKNVADKVTQKGGEVTGNKAQQRKGAAKQVEGELWKKTGTLEQALDKIDGKRASS